jgi:hypothetical protein
MCNLRVEELEARLLLNATGFLLQPPVQGSAALTCTARVAERSSFVDLGGARASPATPSGAGASSREVAPSPSVAPPVQAGTSSEAPVPAAPASPGPGAPTPKPQDGGAAHVSAGPEAGGAADTAVANPEPLPPTPAEPASSSRAADAAPADAGPVAPPQGPTRPPSVRLDDLVAAAVRRAEVQVLTAARFPPEAVSQGEARVVVPGPVLPSSPGPATQPAAGGGEQAGEGPGPTPAPPSGVLAVLPPGDLSALELGMRRFLNQLEQMGQRLACPPEGTGLWPWVVAAAAAAVACDLARRQLRRPVSEPAVDLNRIPGSPPGPFAAG